MGKVALITGGTQRIGRSISKSLAKNGYDILVHYHSDITGANEVVEYARSVGVKAHSIQADLINDTDTLDLVPKSKKLIGKPLTLLINNASIFEYDTIETASLESWDRHLGTNLKAPFSYRKRF